MKNRNTFKSICALLLLSFPLLAGAQVTFQQIYPTSVDQSGRDVIATSDGGYLIAAMSENAIMGDSNIFVIKTNNLGDTVWTRTYGGNYPEYAYSVVPTTDGNYMLAGYTASYGAGDYDSYVMKINPSGDTLWTKTIGGPGDDQAKEIITTSDGNYMITGRSDSQSPGNFDAYLIKLDLNGNILWTKYYGSPNYDTGRSLIQCADGGYAIIGMSYKVDNIKGDVYLVRTNSNGDTLWTKTYGGTNIDDGNAVVENSDGSLTLCSETMSFGAGDMDVQMMKVSASGVPIWSKTYGGTLKDISHMMHLTSDGGYIIGAISRSFGWVEPEMWLIKTNSSGDSTWTRRYGSWDHEHCYAAKETSDGGYMVLGHSKSYGPNTKVMFLKLNSAGQFGPTGLNPISVSDVPMPYPNPTEGIVHVSFGELNGPVSIRIHNVLGQHVFSDLIEPAGKGIEKIIDLKGQQPGIYYMTLESPLHNSTRKIVLK